MKRPREIARPLKRKLSPGRWPRPNTFRVPEVPQGGRVGPPDFVGVGAQKAGTTWWYELIAAHPQVHEPRGRRKELHYFDRYWNQPFTTADVVGYHSFFPRPDGQLSGEWTPRYMVDIWTPALLRQAAPDAKILVILRDPFDRFRSGVTHDLHHRAPRHQILTELAVWRSCYHTQMERLLSHFDRDQVLVQQYERCIVESRVELKHTLAFIGLDEYEPPADLLRDGANVTRGASYQPEPRIREAFIETVAGDLTQLIRDFPEIDPSLWPSCSGL